MWGRSCTPPPPSLTTASCTRTQAFAHQVIADTHEAWKGLVNNPPSSTRLYGVEAARPRGAHLWVPPPAALQE